MGNCASSKYAVDEDKVPKKQKLNKKQKKQAEENATPEVASVAEVTKAETTPEVIVTESPESPKVEKEDIGFIDENVQQDAVKCGETTETTTESKLDDNQKKEVTTYQTTVVKHSQKEGDELLDHLKSEAFRTLQNLLKKQDKTEAPETTTVTTTIASSNSDNPETAQTTENEDIVQQIKAQALVSLGNSKQDIVNSIIDQGAELIKNNTVKNMNELTTELEKANPTEAELVVKVINSTTGFLTAKGTEAGSLLSNILANVSTGLQGVMNETEKTTVKVTRTVTEQVMSGGQLKEVTRVITSDQPMNGSGTSNNIEDVLKNLQNGLGVDGSTFTTTTISGAPEITRTKVVNSGTTESSSSHTEKHENVHQESSVQETFSEDSVTRSQAEKVVSNAVNAAVEKFSEEKSESGLTNGVHRIEETDLHEQITEENIKIEEESSVKTSTTKITLNGEESVSSQIEKAQKEFFQHGKQTAEESINKLKVNDEEEVVNKSSSESNFKEQDQKSEKTTEVTSSS